jgi:photosystem II stability/assembly factor-like uncharacterized protein
MRELVYSMQMGFREIRRSYFYSQQSKKLRCNRLLQYFLMKLWVKRTNKKTEKLFGLSIYILFVSTVLFSCEKYPEPGSETIESFSFNFLGNYQMAEAGNYLAEDIGVEVNYDSPYSLSKKTFYMELEVAIGDGKIDKQKILADESGKMTTKWQLGSKSNEQILNAKIFDSSGQLYADFEMEATAILFDGWNTINSGYLLGIQDMVRDTINQRSMLISRSDLYVRTDKFYMWEPINTLQNTNIKELEINSKGEIYAAAWNGDLYRTTDWGETWDHLGKPIPDNPYHYELTITKDNYIWANKWEHGVYCSIDGGSTWQKDTTGLTKQEELGRIFSFADTSHMAISYYNLTIYQTSDNGVSWIPINTPEYSPGMFVTDNNAIIAQNQKGTGFTLHKSVDGGKSYKEVFSPHVAYGTSSKHCYDKFKNNYYVLAPGGGVWKTRDFEDFEELIEFSLQRNLFIDHSGTLYASGFNYSNAEPDPTLVLPRMNNAED